MAIMTNEPLPELLSIGYICTRLQIHPNTLKQWERKGEITCYRIGIRGDRRYPKEDIMKMIRKDYRQSQAQKYNDWYFEQTFKNLER